MEQVGSDEKMGESGSKLGDVNGAQSARKRQKCVHKPTVHVDEVLLFRYRTVPEAAFSRFFFFFLGIL